MVKVRLVGVSHVYRDKTGCEVMPLKEINLTLAPGDTVSLLGPSGSGKSTLLHILGLLLEPTGGEVILDERPIKVMGERERAAIRSQKIGFVFQRSYLMPTLSVWENIILPLWIKGGKELTEKGARARVDALLEQLDLGERADFLPHQLSGGQRRRVALARAMINEPDLILADEPTAELDAELRTKLGTWLMERAALGKIVVVATHDMVLAGYAQQQYLLQNGRLVAAAAQS